VTLRRSTHRVRAIDRDRAPIPSGIQGFRVYGVIDGETVEARWDPDRFRLGECHPKVRQRAEVVVAIGDSFDCPGSEVPRPATIDDDAAATLLTVVRAIDRVTAIELDLASCAWST
jgi:hypothetical protein